MSDDELKNKSGKVKVMYVRSDDDSDRRTHNPRTGKGGGRPESLVLTVVTALRAMKKRAAVAIVNVTIASVKALAVRVPLRGVPYPVRRVMRRR